MVMVYINTLMVMSMKVIGKMISRMVLIFYYEGHGTYKFSNGSVYIGNFKNGQPHGEGTLDYNVY